jgi:hypothetical protein
MTPPLILAAIPYAEDMNLGAAHNQFMELLPEDGWGCILDHDVMFTTRDWHRQLTAAVLTKPEGCFGGVTNRIKCPFQLLDDGKHIKNHDIKYHREIGKRLLAEPQTLLDVTDHHRTPAGFLMCLSKQAWRDAGKFPDGLHLMDKRMWEALHAVGRRIYIIQQLYLYHWHRGGGPDADPYMEGPWAKRHVLPDGRVMGTDREGSFE